MTRVIVCVAAGLVIAGCESDPLAVPTDDRFVVQAYLYAGEPVTDVRITSTLPVGSSDSIAPPINDANVTLIKDGERYRLALTPGDSGYYHYPGDDLVVSISDVFNLEVTAGGVTATASTVVPPPPEAVSLSTTEVQAGGFLPRGSVVVRWPNSDKDWYFITHENVDPDAEPIFSGTVIIRPSLIVSEPTAADSAVIQGYSLEHYGDYEVSVYRVHPEYEQLYTSRDQDTRDLNEPATNIDNGIGIFTAFSRRNASLVVSRYSQPIDTSAATPSS